MKRKIVDANLLVRNYLSFSIYSATAEHEDEAKRNPNEHCGFPAFVLQNGSTLALFVEWQIISIFLLRVIYLNTKYNVTRD